MLNQCKTTALIQIECIHYRNFVEKKKKTIFFRFRSIKNQHRVSLSLLFFLKKVPLSVPSLLFLQSIRIDIVVTVGTFKVLSAHFCL